MCDDLSSRIGLLTRREVEARVLAPVVAALAREFGGDRVFAIVRRTISEIARQQGADLAQRAGGNTLAHFAMSLQQWTRDDALEIEVVAESGEQLAFNVTRCRYAELYDALGIGELGATLSCARDFGLIEGFNANISLRRTRTIMEGSKICDFRYTTRTTRS